MIRLDQASLEGVFAATSLTLEAGEFCAIRADSDEAMRPLVRLFTGLERPSSGSIQVLGQDLATLSPNVLNALRKQIGVAMRNGGLVSNLRVWENILLPSSYHGVLAEAEAEDKAMGLLKRLGGDWELAKLPGSLSPQSRKLVGLIRAMLTAPDIIIYESPGEGFRGEAKSRLLALLVEFHQEKPGRLSILIEHEAGLHDDAKADRVFTLRKGCLNERD